MVGAHLLNFAGFEEPQQQALHAQGHFPYFIQKHRAVVGDLELAGLISVGAGEAPSHAQTVRTRGAFQEGRHN
jgi:hypothetical protein